MSTILMLFIISSGENDNPELHERINLSILLYTGWHITTPLGCDLE